MAWGRWNGVVMGEGECMGQSTALIGNQVLKEANYEMLTNDAALVRETEK